MQKSYHLKNGSIVTYIENNKDKIWYVLKNDISYDFFRDKTVDFLTKNGFLSSLYLNLNYSCNQNCINCCNPKNMNKYYINFENAINIIKEASSLGIFEVILTGGEPTINYDFLKIAEYIVKNDLRLIIYTNAQKFYDDEYLFEKIVNLNPAIIQTTLFSMNSYIHDSITNVKGSHYKTVEVIKKLKNYNISTAITCPRIALNFKEDLKVKEFAKFIGANFFSLSKFINNKSNNNFDVRVKEDDLIKYYYENMDIKNLRENIKNKEKLPCSGGIDRISIAPNLDIHPCNYFNYPLENYKTSSLANVIKNIVPDFQKKLICKNLKECFKQDYCRFCVYCPIYTCYDSGFLKKSKTLCEDAIAYYKAYLKYSSSKHI